MAGQWGCRGADGNRGESMPGSPTKIDIIEAEPSNRIAEKLGETMQFFFLRLSMLLPG